VLGVAAVPYIAASRGQALLAELELFRWAKPALRVERPSFSAIRTDSECRSLLWSECRAPGNAAAIRTACCRWVVGPCNCSTDSRDTTASGACLATSARPRCPVTGAPESRAVSPLLAESGGRGRRERRWRSYFARVSAKKAERESRSTMWVAAGDDVCVNERDRARHPSAGRDVSDAGVAR